MRKANWKVYVFWIGIAETVGLLSGLLSMQSMKVYAEQAVKPPLSPPEWLFPVVWTILFALMGIGAARIYLSAASKSRSRGLNLWVTQLIVNFFWPLLFFNVAAYGFAFFWLLLLWGLVLWMILAFRNVDPVAAVMQIPYLVWLNFAAYLNAGVWYLNR